MSQNDQVIFKNKFIIMKKLSLKDLKLDVNDLLEREQLKTIFGGSGGSGEVTPGCPGYSHGKYTFLGGNGYSGCECVSLSAGQWATANYTHTTLYYDLGC